MPAAFAAFPELSRRSVVGSLAGVSAGAVIVRSGVLAQSTPSAASPAASPAVDDIGAIQQILDAAMDDYKLRSIIATVRRGDEELLLTALGESMTGVPATTDMYFRNGAVAIALIATVMLILVDHGTIGLDEPIGTWLPDLPDSDKVTFRMLANMTSGYRDYVQNPDFGMAQQKNPFHSFTREEMLQYAFAQPRIFAPGENWEYSHAGYQIMGWAIERATGETFEGLMQRLVLDPLGLKQTFAYQTAIIPEPALHAFSSERRQTLQIPDGVGFYEESTYWDPAWTITKGAVQVQTIRDMATAMMHVGKGTLLSPALHEDQVGPSLDGFGQPQEGCNSCRTLGPEGGYGLGVFRLNGWLMQSPLFCGYAGTAGYHPEHDLTVAVQVTFAEDSFDSAGDYQFGNSSTTIFERIGEALTKG